MTEDDLARARARTSATSPGAGSRATRCSRSRTGSSPARPRTASASSSAAAAGGAAPRRLRLAGAGAARRAVTALLRALPKAIRRHVVPAADWAAKLGDDLRGPVPKHHDGLPAQTLTARWRPHPARREPARDGRRLRPRAGARPPAVTFRAVDHRGRTVGTSRDLAELQRVSPAAPASRSPARSRESRRRRARRRRRDRTRRHPARCGDHRRAHRHHDVGRRHAARGRGHARRRRRRARLSGARGREGCRGAAHRVHPERAARLTHAGVRRLLLLAVPRRARTCSST
jgi:ATP-dependent helicase HrpA